MTDVGPKLADEIPTPNTGNHIKDYLGKVILNSIFLEPVVEKEIINVENICKSKHPATVETGVFPEKMKTA